MKGRLRRIRIASFTVGLVLAICMSILLLNAFTAYHQIKTKIAQIVEAEQATLERLKSLTDTTNYIMTSSRMERARNTGLLFAQMLHQIRDWGIIKELIDYYYSIDPTGYIFILDKNAKLLLHPIPNAPKEAPKDVENAILAACPEGFAKYMWKKPGGEVEEKITFVKCLEDPPVIVGVSIYTSDIQQSVKTINLEIKKVIVSQNPVTKHIHRWTPLAMTATPKELTQILQTATITATPTFVEGILIAGFKDPIFEKPIIYWSTDRDILNLSLSDASPMLAAILVLSAIFLTITESAYARVELLENIKQLLEEATGEEIREDRKLIDAIRRRLSHIKNSLTLQNLSDQIVKEIGDTKNPEQLLWNAWRVMQTGNVPINGIEAELLGESGHSTQIVVGSTHGDSIAVETEGLPRTRITIYHPSSLSSDETEGLRKIASLLAKVSSEMWGRMTDPLTGLWTRDILKPSQSCSRCAAIMIDVDNFKQINDTSGHIYGDKVLKELANCIRYATRKSDIAIRYGGDEFLIIVRGIPIHVAENIARRIIRCFSEGDFSISVGIGYCEMPISLEELIHLADQALYEAKEKKNAISVKRCKKRDGK